MRKLFLPLLMLSLLFWSCKKDKEPDYATLILGTWINTQVDNQAVLTDASFTFEFRSDNIQPYAMGYQLDADNKTWIQNDNYLYSVTGNKITIDGISKLGLSFHMEFLIISVDENTLTYSVSKFVVDNVDYPDPKVYTNKKVTVDYSVPFASTWYGKSTTPEATDTSFHYWSYKPDGHFSYYYRNAQGKWVNKQDNEGGYFLYGDLLATNFTNDLISGATGKSYECWNIAIRGDTMWWNGLRADGIAASYRMERVAGPPVVN